MLLKQTWPHLLAVAAGALTFIPSSSKAECLDLVIPPPQELNICKKAVEEFVVPAVFRPVTECTASYWQCIAQPHCCTPLCIADPTCTTVRLLLETASYVVHPDEVYCGLQDIDAEELLVDIGEARYMDLTSLATGGTSSILYKFGGAAVDALACDAGRTLPSAVKTLVNKLASFSSDPKFTGVDVNRTSIVSEANEIAGALLPDHNGLTLDSLVIFKTAHYNRIVNWSKSWDDLIRNKLSSSEIDTLSLLIHELVHVRQYREKGREAFANRYLAEALVSGYGDITMEREANEFEVWSEQEIKRQQRRFLGAYTSSHGLM